MAAYHPLVWHDFFVGTIGASAAFTGLLFVAVSINLQQILKFPHLPGRAAGTLGVLLSALVVSGFSLAPSQGNRVLGLEIAATGAVVAAQAVWITPKKLADDEQQSSRAVQMALLLLPSLAAIAGGLSLIAGGGGGLYWVLAAVLLAFVVASINGWVLLVEILR
jgi:hypothetical protein